MSQKSRTQSVMGQNQITEGVIWKQLLLFFFPILFGTFFQQLYNTADVDCSFLPAPLNHRRCRDCRAVRWKGSAGSRRRSYGNPDQSSCGVLRRTFFRCHRNYIPVLRCETAGPGEQGGTYVNSIFHRGRHCPHGHRCGRRAVGLIRHGNTG